jgi:hypothetical protein
MSSFAPAVVVASHRSALPPADATVQQLWEVIGHQAQTIEQLQQRVEWFTRQIFGHKSERFAPEPPPEQMHLGQVLGEPPRQARPRLRRRRRGRFVLRRDQGARAHHRGAQPRSAGSRA